jgi:AAHS family 4-hydroxybenzoate transporter-like MFS transporter
MTASLRQFSYAADPRITAAAWPMSPTQWGAVIITIALSALDGFDVLAVTLAAPKLVSEWHMDHAALGVVLSAGLFGMVAGSFLLAPLADVLGRRRIIFLTLFVMGAGMILSATAHGVWSLALYRLITGIGIGGMIPVINPLATEFANAQRRDLAVTVMAVGYPLGGVLGATVAASMMTHFRWPILFYWGAALSCLMGLVVWRWLPEPLSFLIERPTATSLSRINDLLKRCRQPLVTDLPPPVASNTARWSALFGPKGRLITLRLAAVSFFYVAAVYYVLSWIPQLVADLGFSASEAATVAFGTNLAGILGGLAFGWATLIISVRPLTVVVFICFAGLTVVFSHLPADLGLLRIHGAALGFFLIGGMCILHPIVSRNFPDHIRASGVGLVIGFGRVGASLAPISAGLLFSAGVGRGAISFVAAGGTLLAALLLATMRDQNEALAKGEHLPLAPVDTR